MLDFRLFVPGLLISITSILCPVAKTAGVNVPFRPPGWVFGVVWPILYVTTGMAWSRTKLDMEFTILTALLCYWLVTYSCNNDKTSGRNVLIVATLYSYYMLYTMNSRLLFLPLSMWLTFATYLNFNEVLISSSSPRIPGALRVT